ncbi:MAG: hypothetical protein KatS3mg096_731 [Candidatus Parcubacteria bacterium]|nr:MAG: hypothetical protein KatS3mg096_731 [Candidatus Parcubacteria bacterium]
MVKGFSLIKSLSKAVIQALIAGLSSGIVVLSQNLPVLNTENATLELVAFYVVFILLNVFRNWLKVKFGINFL